MSSILRIHLLGDVLLSLNDTPLTGLKSRTVEGLCIYLACHQKPIAREILYTLFWPTTPEKQAKANLRGALSYLRKHIADHLIVSRQAIGFDNTKQYFVDAQTFEAEIEKLLSDMGDTAVTPTQADTLRTCLDLYRGDFLQGFTLDFALGFDEWAVLKRERLHWLAVRGLKKLVAHYLDIGNYPEALRYSSRHLHIDPLDESVHRQQMWLFMRLGDRHKALSQYAACRQMLQTEFGLEPAPATEAVYQKIQQIKLPPPAQLPTYVTPFFGREAQVQAIVKRFLHAANPGILTLLGMGGSGKSRLATQAATLLATHHPGRFLDGIQFIPLVAIDSLDSLLINLAAQLDIKLSGSTVLTEQLIEVLRKQEILLIFDNFEHLVDNETIIDFLIKLMTAAANTRLLITSRTRLLLQAEQVMRVDGLAYPTATPLDDISYEAGQLFQNRAGRITGNYELDAEESTAVWQICRAVEGIPIAIELAAGATWQKSVNQIAADIQTNIDLLATTMRDVPARHRSVRAVFDHSWGLLSDHERQTLARLSIFPAAFAVKAAREILAATRKELRTLADKSLLRDLGDNRFDLHPLLKTFAAEHLAESEIWLNQHADFYLTWLADLEETISSAAQPQVVAEIALDYDNVHAAWETALHTGNLKLLTDTRSTLHRYFNTKGGIVAGEKLFRESADYVEERYGRYQTLNDEQKLALALLRSRQSWFTYMLGQYNESLALQRACIPIFRQFGVNNDLARALSEESTVLRRMGEFEAARTLLRECLALRMIEEDGHAIGFTLLNLASTTRSLGDIDGSENYLLEAREISKTFDDTSLTATIANDLGEVASARADWEAAQAYYNEGLAGYIALDDTFRMGISHNNLGSVSHRKKEFAAARQHAEESIKLFKEAGSYRSLPFPLSILGRTAQDEGKPQEALNWYQQALKIADEYNAIAKLLIILFDMTFPLRDLGHRELAATILAFLKEQSRLDANVLPQVVTEFDSLAAKVDMVQVQEQAAHWTLQDAIEKLLTIDEPNCQTHGSWRR